MLPLAYVKHQEIGTRVQQITSLKLCTEAYPHIQANIPNVPRQHTFSSVKAYNVTS